MNIQIKQWILMLLTSFIVFVSCSKDDEGSIVQTLEVETSAVLFIQNAGVKTVSVIADNAWTVSVPDEAAGWCTADRSGDELQIFVEENESVDERTTVLTLKTDALQKTLVVKQTGISPSIMLELKDETKGAVALFDQLTFEIPVTANVPYELIYDENVSWVRNVELSEPDVNGSSKVTFTLSRNEAEADRRTELTFKQLNGDYYTCVTLTQRKDLGAQFDLVEEWFSTEAGVGTMKIGCMIPEDKIFSRVMVEYNHPRKGAQAEIFEKTEMGNIVIKDLLNRDGEYAFSVSALNEDGEPLSTDPMILRGACIAVPASISYTEDEQPLALTGESFLASCEDIATGKILNGTYSVTDYEKWADGVYGPNGGDNKMEVHISVKDNATGKDAYIGVEFLRVRIAVPEDTDIKAFKFKTVQRQGQWSQAPRVFDIGVGDENKMTTTLCSFEDTNANLENRQRNGDWTWSSEILDPESDENMEYIWFYVYDRWDYGGSRTQYYFVLGEIMVINAIPFIYDPENMTDEEMMK